MRPSRVPILAAALSLLAPVARATPNPTVVVTGTRITAVGQAGIVAAPADLVLLDAYRRRARNVPVEVTAVVTKLLRDDRFGIQHQKFLIRAAGLSILVAHNLDIAARVPVQPGDTIRIRGEYAWNANGGVLHWTHKDPRRRHAAGFIEVRGQRVQ